MYYVIQTSPGMETEVECFMQRLMQDVRYERSFFPTRRMQRKIKGKWYDKIEKLFPGYVFVITDHIDEVYAGLKRVPAMTKLLGRDKDAGTFYPLNEEETAWLKKLMNIADETTVDRFDAEVALSHIDLDENDRIVVKDGPLKNMEGMIKKLDPHKKLAVIEVDFMNKKTQFYLGLEYVKKK